MIRTSVRILVAVLIALLIWWVGPLFAFGIYHPFGPVWIRELLIAAVLAWGAWPALARLWMRLAMSPRQIRMPKRVIRETNLIDEQIRNLDRKMKDRWQCEPRSRWRRWTGALRGEHRIVMPWYFVLGAEGSGKTSLVTKAVNTTDAKAQRASVADPVVSRGDDFNFRISNDAVWLDIGGRWNLRDGLDDTAFDAWKKLLRGLRRLRGSTPISGVVLCVESASLVDTPHELRKHLADVVRRRLLEMREAFGHEIQVYVALNGIDRLDGAISMLSLIDHDRWVNGVGFCLPAEAIETDAEAASADWQSALLQLQQRIQQQVLFAAPAATEVETNFAQLRFVEVLSQLHQALLVWLQIAIAPGEVHSAARLRGVWMGSMAELAVAQSGASPTAPTRPLCALWTPLFRQVALERDGARSRQVISWRSRINQMLRWATLPALAICLLLWLGWGYFEERNYLEDVSAQFNEAKRLAQVSHGPDGGSPLLDVAGQMRYARAQAADSDRGMATPYFEHGRVADVAAATYQRQLKKMLMPELYNEVLRTLVAQVDGAPGDIYQTLKIYLMLCRSNHRNAADFEHWLSDRWDSLSGGQYGEDDRRELLAHVRALIGLPTLPSMPEDANLVRAARARAAQIPLVTRVLQNIRAQGLPAQITDISLSRAAGFEAAMSLRMRSNVPTTDAVVSGWFTRAGYTDVFLPRLETSAREMLEEESWVLRDEPLRGNSFQIDSLVQKLADSTRAQFLQDYIASWQSFLNDVTVRSVTGLDDASQLAAAMMDSQSPIASLLRFSARETTLTGASDEGNIDSWIDRQKYRLEKGRRQIVGELSGQHYRTVLLPEYVVEEHFQAIRQLAAQLNNHSASSSDPLSRLFEPLYRQLGLVNGALQAGQVLPAQYDAFSRLKETAARQPEPVRGIMLDLISNGSTMSTRESGALLSRGATGAMSTVCSTGFTNRYPFRRSAQLDAGVQDFERLFGAQGLMATYFRDHLEAYVDTSSTPWKALHSNGGNLGLVNPGVLASYEKAERIRGGMLDDSGHLKVSTVLRFIDMDPQLSEAQLTIGGQTLRYAHGVTTPRRIDWSGQSNRLAIQLQLKSVDGRLSTLQFDGPWALFRFFDAGQAAGGMADRRERLYQTSLGMVLLEWQALTTPSPIWSGMLQSFSCP
ncbi:type VI secretion protein IcmF [Burkholderia cepacia]|uniref:type VI secretion system membrane subunit TssM n=1 Tax=Burkholderia cepacia TaxID=292 RepID=UPI00075A4B1C|nr:type VI secretion system membrane subunit TssM [Burkholderia cepacia]KVS53630.1 type VI secretion protein IcmF [Burkholderia cepacia]KVS58977.1 type VI secretion protein IcmF [Burkholderia cepacia]RQT71878.1 type VI secretion system membrane subunit TssM [Burkholderia cepacia]RQT92292.1 type VI secretion system membrane subunit TssM [Burkholderia cepacia]RQZ68908.1 type VI secretion system membrane subunit TssM [Burkholderia cepacia]